MENITAKRKRTNENDQIGAPSTKKIILEELEFELALKDRIVATTQSRITWALLLQESLKKELNAPASSENDFRNAALDALNTIDDPCNLLFQRESTLDSDPKLTAHLEAISLCQVPDSPVRSYSARNRLPRASQSVHKFLFVRNTSTTPSLIARLQCTDCSRWDFSTTQGFLNHCRIRHQRDYGNHDECIQHCSVLVPENERDWVVQNGTEISGVGIPSLRRLFETAVGGKSSSVLRISPPSPTSVADESQFTRRDSMAFDGTHLSRTLGLHKDTPALAPFLGRAAQRRYIDVTEQDEQLDIDSEVSNSASIWRMPFSHRNRARPELDAGSVSQDPPEEVQAPLSREEHITETDTLHLSSTRFHIVARVLVADRSRWLPPGKRPSAYPEHTHGWMLSIDSPSYSLHVTTILTSVSVSCLTDPPPSTLVNPIVISGPPFVVTSTTDKPFLAQISLMWNGPQNSSMEIEHWVEIDPMRTGYTVPGDQQLLDIELDRKTELLPVRQNLIQWNDLSLSPIPRDDSIRTPGASSPHAEVLSSLLSRIPMTMRDVKVRGSHAFSHQVSYMLVSNPTQFQNLVPGRRKAIEWGRARALHAAYSEHRDSSSKDLLSLTVGDVYSWLEDQNLFPRLKRNKPSDAHEKVPMTSTSHIFCPSCGFPPESHAGIVKIGSPSSRFSCATDLNHYTKPPLVDATKFSRCGYGTDEPPYPIPVLPDTRDIVLSANPKLMTVVQEFVSSMKLPSFETKFITPDLEGARLPGLFRFRISKDEVEQYLAPYAVLSLATESFVRHLVGRALNVSESRRHLKSSARSRVITPSHVFQVLHRDISHAHSLTDFVIAGTLARLGTTVAMQLRDGRLSEVIAEE